MSCIKQKAAFFDIDGTICKGFIIRAFPEYLCQRGFFEPAQNKKIQELLTQYNNGEIDASFAAREIPLRYALGLKGQKKEKISELATGFMHEYRSNVYFYSKPLVDMMHTKGFLTIAMSGSPIEAIEKLDFLGFDAYYGSEMSLVSGTYNGLIKTNLVMLENKRKLFEEIVSSRGISLDTSFGFGDTEQDIPMLEKVHYPFAVNPNKKLRMIAEQNGWIICDEKDVVLKTAEVISGCQ